MAASAGSTNEAGEVDLSKVSIPSSVEVSEADIAASAKKSAATPRKKVAAPKA